MDMNIGQTNKRPRRQKDMTQEQLADEFLMSTRTYGKLERGETDVKLSTLERMAAVFGVTVSNLLSTEFDLSNAAENVMRRISRGFLNL